MSSKSSYTIPFIIITLLFFAWGFITVFVDSLVPRLKAVFELTFFQAGLVQMAFFLAYLLVSIPAGKLISKTGYKKGIIIGLMTMALGCFMFYPASSFRIYTLFLLALFVLASGITILQVAANPYVSVLGEEKLASSRLNLAQAFNSLGTALAPILAATFVLSSAVKTKEEIAGLSFEARNAYFEIEASAVQTPFITVGIILVLLAVMFVFFKLPKIIQTTKTHLYKGILQKPGVRIGVIGIFLYVGAEVAIGSWITDYLMTLNIGALIGQSTWLTDFVETTSGHSIDQMIPRHIAGSFVTIYWTSAMIGRFVGAGLTAFGKPRLILKIFALFAIALLIITISSSGIWAFIPLLLVGFFNSIMFPTIFTLTLEGNGEDKPQISGLLCTAIFGGALIPPLFGLLTDVWGFSFAFFLPMACYAYIFWFGNQQSNGFFKRHK